MRRQGDHGRVRGSGYIERQGGCVAHLAKDAEVRMDGWAAELRRTFGHAALSGMGGLAVTAVKQ